MAKLPRIGQTNTLNQQMRTSISDIGHAIGNLLEVDQCIDLHVAQCSHPTLR